MFARKFKNFGKFQHFPEQSAKFWQNFIKIWAKISEKNSKITKFCNFLPKHANYFFRKKLTKIFWKIEVWAVQKHVNIVDLVKSLNAFPTIIFSQNLASIQQRTSLIKFDHYLFWMKNQSKVRYRTFQLRPELVVTEHHDLSWKIRCNKSWHFSKKLSQL